MLKNYITVAVRNLLRQKLYAFINIFGLALGIACCLLMAMFVQFEWSHDRFHKHRDRIFRLYTSELQPNGNVRHVTLFAPETPQALKDNLPGVALATGFIRSRGRITFGSKTFQESVGLVHADFLKIFTFPLLAGDPATALDRPDAIVITEPVAQKFFGDLAPNYSNVLGQSLTFPTQNLTFVITGIAASVPKASSLVFDVLIPAKYENKFGQDNINNACMSVYVELAEHQTVQQVETALHSFIPAPVTEYVSERKKWGGLKDSKDAFSLDLQPLTDVYWNDTIGSHYEAHGSLTGVYILWGIAILVVLIACSNFTTLSVAQSSSRAKEVGMRKVLGANRYQIAQQFWSEALLLSFFGLLIGIALAELFLPVFNGLIQRNLEIGYSNNGPFLMILVCIIIVVGLLSGGYPSLILSRLQPTAAMKGEHHTGGRSYHMRTLVVLQYAVSIALMVCTSVMLNQQHYLQNKNLGYDKEHVIVVGTEDGTVADRYKKELLENPHVLGVTITDRAFTNGAASRMYKMPSGEQINVRQIRADTGFLPTLKIKLIEGRNFSKDHPSDSTDAVIINETLAHRLNMKNPVGQTLSGLDWGKIKNPVIIGVVQDFNIDALYKNIQPLILQMSIFHDWPHLMIRVQPGDMENTVAMLKEAWKKVAPPDEQIRLSFLDENLNRQYPDEQRWQRVLTYSAIFAIAISCLGLLGLVSIATTRRTKEIGIRKVLGASVSNLVNLLSKDFIKLLILSNVIAWPIAYWAMDKWLTNFAYHIHLGISAFALSGALALVIALLTISAQTLKAARRNPVDALKYE